MRHIVAVADKCELQSLKSSFLFINRQQIRQNLTGMEFIRKAVDNRNRTKLRQFLQIALLKRADHDAVYHAEKHHCQAVSQIGSPRPI